MKMLHVPTSSLIARLIQSFVLILVFTLYSPNYSSGQTLFEIATELDSLYDKVQADSSVAIPFFKALQKVYGSEATIRPAAIKKDIQGNRFLQDITFVAYQQFGRIENKNDSRLNKLKSDRDSVYQLCTVIISDACYNSSSSTCNYTEDLENIRANIEYEYYIISDLEKLIAKVKEPKEATKQLKKLLLDLSKIEFKISKLEKTGESVFIKNQQSVDIMPVTSSAITPQITPIIIQQQGGGSAQSAIIDGTAKWLAERMRQELSIAFFDRFENWAEQKSISYLFPNTLSVLQTSANTDYTLMMEVYKNAFDKDLNQLIFNLPIFLEKELVNEKQINNLVWDMASLNYKIDSLDKAQEYFNQTRYFTNPFEYYELTEYSGDTILTEKPYEDILALENNNFSYEDYYQKRESYYSASNEKSQTYKTKRTFKYINFALEAIQQLKNGSHPSTLLSYLNNNANELFQHNSRLKSSLILLDVLSQGLTKVDEKNNTVWIGKKEVEKLRDNSQFRGIFFGLLHYKIKQIIRSERQNWEISNPLFYSQEGYECADSIQRLINTRKNLINDFCKYARDPIYKYKSNRLALQKNWKSIISQYTPSNEYLIPNYNKEDYKDLLGFILFTYNAEIDNSYELYDFSQEEYKRAMDQFNIDLQNTIDTIRSVSNEKDPYDESLSIEYPIDILMQLYSTPSDNLFGGPNPRLDTSNIENSQFLAEVGEPFSWFYKNPEDWSNVVWPSLNQIVEKRITIYNKYKSYHSSLSNIENQISTNYYNNVLLRDSLHMVMEYKATNKDWLRNDLEVSLLQNTQLYLDGLILGEYQQQRFGKLINDFIQFANKIDRINSEFKTLKKENNGDFGNQEFLYLIKNSVDALDLILELAIDNPNDLANIKFVTNNILDAYQAGLNKDYNGLVMNIIPVVQKIVTDKYQTQIDALVKEDLVKHNLTELQIIDLPNNPVRDSLKLILDDKMRKMQDVFKYATFAAAVAESNNSEDVKKAIQAIALPVGSYSIKRRTFRNISLNAYPGLTGGAELIQNSTFSEWAPNFGFTAPIGIGVNWGYRSKRNIKKYNKNLTYQKRIQRSEKGPDGKYFSGHSGSVFFPLVDLGALVLFRLNDSDEPLPDDVGLKQIFSPGAMYVHGLPGVPISIMGGFQMTPGLRKVGEDVRANSFRINLSVVVDLPIANFHTRRTPKIKKKDW